ncbi:Zn-ribbon domain-containing OB-fold protein [Cryptosporangium aurantiacum]|uniref:DUF35 OB-fold domain-containing protein, acyl-CoA-associated n=1 Tax=Cryptosporangium aurantiacum TaxID=134849 RepID=A0A1M7RKH0_9ACTN|nr:OB-fold domain-containing protein [Cryptosporangium aurantiacum]SHN46662.1 DUF35 OB-fold domain-containing protein, acyl-CoA-associated [Cryptosporangium aurantiacum]
MTDAGQLVVQRCRGCATWLWGPRRICPSCHGFDLGWEPVAAEGTVYTWCRSHHPYVAELEVPYTTVLAELPGAGNVRVLGLLAAGSRAPAIGDRVVGDVNSSTVYWRVA